MQPLRSRAWSCSELTAAGADLVDKMVYTSPHAAVVEMQHSNLALTAGMGLEEMQKLLEVPSKGCSLCYCRRQKT